MTKIDELRKLTDEIEKEYKAIRKHAMLYRLNDVIGWVKEFAINNADREDVNMDVMKELVEFIEERREEYKTQMGL
jgi:hypothetical protein